MHNFPRLKFCGMTREEDVEAAVDVGADAIGLNFYPRSKRYILPDRAKRLSDLAVSRLMRVGVFVDASPQQVSEVVDVCPIDAIQLHGDESIEWLDQARSFPTIAHLPIIRAMAYRGAEDDTELSSWLDWGVRNEDRPLAILVDAYDPIERGGTGKQARWDLLNPRPSPFDRFSKMSSVDHQPRLKIPLMLAGGITIENVAEAIQTARPDGIDVASGIETKAGIKDCRLMKEMSEIALRLL